MKIFLHIGTEKTGTTSIQSYLVDNRELLRQHKIMYSKVLGDPNNIRLSIALQNTDKIDDSRVHAKLTKKEDILTFREKLRQDIKEEIALQNPDALVISSEHLSSRMNKEEEVKRLKIFLNELSDDVTIIIYIRRQDKFFESLYSTAIKKGNVMDFSFPNKGQEREDFHYNRMLILWENIFGINNIKVKIFDKNKLYQHDIISDFIDTLKLPLLHKPESSKRENTSFGRKKLAFLKEFNTFVPEIIKQRTNPIRGNIEELLEKVDINDESIQMTNVEKSAFLERFEDGNRQIAKRYFHNDRLFDDVIDKNHQKKDIHLDTLESIEIFSKIWRKKQLECIDKLFNIRTLEIELALSNKDYKVALNLAKSFFSQHPDHPRTNYLYAKALYNNNQIIEAKKYSTIATETNPNNIDFSSLLALINKRLSNG